MGIVIRLTEDFKSHYIGWAGFILPFRYRPLLPTIEYVFLVSAAPHYDFANSSVALLTDADSYQQTLFAGAENQFFDSLFSRFEMVALAFVAGFQNKTFEVTKAIKKHFSNFSGEAIELTALGTAWYARVVSRWGYRVRINSEIPDLIAELANVTNENRVPGI